MLSSGNMTGTEMGELLAANLEEMETLAMSQPAPFIAVLSPIDLRLVFPKPEVDPPTSTEP